MRAEVERDHIREKRSTRERCGRRCRAFPFLYGTVFRDGSACTCVELRKPSPCNNSFSKNFGDEIAVGCSPHVSKRGGKIFPALRAFEMRRL